MQKVLIIEDKKVMQLLMKEVLEERGYAVRVMEPSAARSVSTAVFEPDVAIVDVDVLHSDVPDTSSVQALRKAFPKLPIIGLSATSVSASQSDKTVCYLQKPVDFAVLAKLVDLITTHCTHEKAARSQQPQEATRPRAAVASATSRAKEVI